MPNAKLTIHSIHNHTTTVLTLLLRLQRISPGHPDSPFGHRPILVSVILSSSTPLIDDRYLRSQSRLRVSLPIVLGIVAHRNR